MIPTLLFIIATDPRTDHRPAEAIRIAAGVCAWKSVRVALYLREAAVLALGHDVEPLVDYENYTSYLPMLLDGSSPIYVQRGAPLLPPPDERPPALEEIDDAQLAELSANSTYVLRF